MVQADPEYRRSASGVTEYYRPGNGGRAGAVHASDTDPDIVRSAADSPAPPPPVQAIPGRLRVTLLILSLNELDGMKAIMPRIRREWIDEILVMDGGSKDGTVEYCESHGYRVFTQTRRGLRFAMMEGVAKATGDIVITFSPDGNSVPERIPDLVRAMASGNEMVIVSRYKGNATSHDDSLVTRFGNWMFTFMHNLLFRTHYTDAMVMFRAFRRDLPMRLGLYDEESYQPMERWLKTSAGWEVLMSVRVAKKRLRWSEIPGDEPPRIGGKAKMLILRWGFFNMCHILKELFLA